MQKKDNVLEQTGEPTWLQLVFALQTIRQSTLASQIIDEKKGKPLKELICNIRKPCTQAIRTQIRALYTLLVHM